jgi:tRNA dimethylallyltransferase
MFDAGLVDETRSLLAAGAPAEAKPFASLGYKEALAVMRGDLLPAQAIEHASTETRQYAKRQMTWFRREPDVRWLAGFGENPDLRSAAKGLVAAFLSG